MSRRRQAWRPYDGVSADELARQHYGTRKQRDPADLTVIPEPTLEDEWAQAFGDALLFGAILVVLGASTPFVLLALAWLGWG